MNVSFVIDGVSNSGGTDRVLSMLSNAFSARGNKVTVHSLSAGDAYYKLDEHISLKNYGDLGRLSALKKIIKLEKKTGNKIIVISMGKLSVQYIILSKILMAKNEIVCSDHVGIKSFSKHIRILKLACYILYNKVVTLTTSDCEYISKFPFMDKNKVISIKNMSPYISLNESELLSARKEMLAIAVGRLSYQKNFLRLINLWDKSQTDNWRLLIIGDGDQRLALESLIESKKISNIEISHSTKDIHDYYRKASCLLMTSRYEGLPMVLIEAKSFGLPVIAFDCPSGPSEVIDDDGYLIDYDDDESYIKHLNLLMSDKNLKKKFALKALANSQKFSEDKIYSSWYDLLNDEKNNFSVLMSLYHKETATNLGLCLDSLLSQTLRADEVVVVLDGPIPKELNDVLDKYIISLNIIIVPIEKNVGLGKALNVGIESCSYDIIARMDTDDVCQPNRFERQIAEFVKDPTLVMVGSSIIEFDVNGDERLKRLPLEFNAIKKFSVKKNPFNHMTVMFKKEDILSSGSYIHHYYMEDYNLWLRLISANKNIINIDETLVKARVDRSTMLKRRGLKYIYSEIQLYKLKHDLGISMGPVALFYLIMRVIPRLLPVSILRILYSLDRH